ncbi:hypothetical protein N7519_000435 [Penicillium mononematosum]|uniref:uncharacterized protein n=1 Tax=Penicillium mononematosum TaxID=268346 RepID=UPI00254909F7|nr:uncharacterized protein N7519_000435 [Penicillium mononematosum]KAJ6190414.1 hypothetical protein N7519_000435 [Penicillium mononematosum]
MVFKQGTKLSRAKKAFDNYDWEGSWVWEIGVVYLALLIGFLGYVDGKAYLSWQYSISPNAVISVIANFAKAAMLVLVSICLGQLKWRQGHDQNPRSSIISIFLMKPAVVLGELAGAALMVLAVAIDPFTQQILSFPSRQVQVLNETAYVFKPQEFHTKSDGGAFRMDPTMQIAMFNGLTQTNAPLDPICPSESCDYPDFTTLGICTNSHTRLPANSKPIFWTNSTQKWSDWHMRLGVGQTKVSGRAYQTETYILVRWLRAILPIVTVILSISLFLATVIVSRGQPVLWKSSVFPLLMGLLQVAPEHEIANIRHLGQIQSMSKEIKIVVEGKDNGPLLFSER